MPFNTSFLAKAKVLQGLVDKVNLVIKRMISCSYLDRTSEYENCHMFWAKMPTFHSTHVKASFEIRGFRGFR